MSICPCGSAFCISVTGACGRRVCGTETAGVIVLWLEALDRVGMVLWIMAVFMMSLGRENIGVAAGEEGVEACTGVFAGSRGAAFGACGCGTPCMLKATGGAAWLAVRLGAGARTNCPPTPGGNASKNQ